MQATSGLADLVGPLLGSWAMSYRIWIPFLLATICFFSMFIPALLIDDNYDDQVEIRDGIDSTASEQQSLLHDDDSVSESDDPTETNTRNLPPWSKAGIFTTSFVSFFLLCIARDSTNYVIPWVSLRCVDSRFGIDCCHMCCWVPNTQSYNGESRHKEY
jgi:hypothetical protein